MYVHRSSSGARVRLLFVAVCDRGVEFQSALELLELTSYPVEIVGNNGWYRLVGRYMKGGRIGIHGQRHKKGFTFFFADTNSSNSIQEIHESIRVGPKWMARDARPDVVMV